MTTSIYWLIFLAVFLLIEILTLGLTTIWFAGGALIAFILSLFIDNLWIEITVFFVISFLLLLFTRPLVLKYFNPRREKTNYESLIGKFALVTDTINNLGSMGSVKINGQEWSARSLNEETIEKGSYVKIHRISGVKLIVSKKEENE